jgi:CRISPR/Cas system-associated endonuclease Cas1
VRNLITVLSTTQARYSSIISKTNILAQIKCRKWQDFDKWNEILLGLEGQAASQYWQCLVAWDLMPNDF